MQDHRNAFIERQLEGIKANVGREYFDACIEHFRQKKQADLTPREHAFISAMAWVKLEPGKEQRYKDFCDLFDAVSQDSLFYVEVQCLLGLMCLDKNDIASAQKHLFAALTAPNKTDSDIRLLLETAEKLPTLYSKRDAFYIRAAICGVDVPQEKIKHLVTISHEFLDNVDAITRYNIINNLGLSNAERNVLLKQLEEALNQGRLQQDPNKVEVLQQINKVTTPRKLSRDEILWQRLEKHRIELGAEKSLHLNDISSWSKVMGKERTGRVSSARLNEEISSLSSVYGDAQYLLGLRRDQEIGGNNFPNADIRAASHYASAASAELPNEGDARKARRQFASERFLQIVDSKNQPNNFFIKEVLCVKAALLGHRGAQDRVSHLCNFNGGAPHALEFKPEVSAFRGYKIIQGLRVQVNYYSDEEYVAELNKLKSQLSPGGALNNDPEREKILDKVEREILIYDKNLRSEKAIEKFFEDSVTKGPKLKQKKENVLGQNGLSDYWRRTGRSIRRRADYAMFLVTIPFMLAYYVVRAAAFLIAGPIDLGKKAKAAWDRFRGRSPEKQKAVDTSIASQLEIKKEKRITKKSGEIPHHVVRGMDYSNMKSELSARYRTRFFPRVDQPANSAGVVEEKQPGPRK